MLHSGEIRHPDEATAISRLLERTGTPLPLDLPVDRTDPTTPALQRSRRLSTLLRKRMILEGLLRELAKPTSP
jgi:hypothetical protein